MFKAGTKAPSEVQTALLGNEHDCYYAIDPRSNPNLRKSLAGKNVLVTGAGRGVGRSIALFLTHASAKSLTAVALEQNEVDSTIQDCKAINPELQTKSFALDVTDPIKVEAIVREVEASFGSIDVLVCNAGRPPQWLPTVECDPKIWWDTVAVSLQGAFLFSRYSLPGMQKAGRGAKIIFTSSAGAHSNAGMGSYTLGKLGMVRLAEILHRENHDFNIKAFAYNPGRVKTRFFTDFEDVVMGRGIQDGSYVVEGLAHEDKSAEIAWKALKDVTFDTPELPAGLVTALAAGKLDFMSGRYLDASVNIDEYMRHKEAIVKQDLFRVRLKAGDDVFIPTLEY